MTRTDVRLETNVVTISSARDRDVVTFEYFAVTPPRSSATFASASGVPPMFRAASSRATRGVFARVVRGAGAFRRGFGADAAGSPGGGIPWQSVAAGAGVTACAYDAPNKWGVYMVAVSAGGMVLTLSAICLLLFI